MIDSYATLQSSIASFLHRSDLTSIIPEFIADAETRIYNELRIRAMEAAYTGSTSSAALPSVFLEWIFLTATGSHEQKLTRKDAEWIYTHYPERTGQGMPKYFAREGNSLIFGPSPDSDYTITGRYYKKLTPLSDSNTTNWLISDAPALIRYAALCEAAPYLADDSRIAIWEAKVNLEIQRIKQTERRESRSGSLLSATAG